MYHSQIPTIYTIEVNDTPYYAIFEDGELLRCEDGQGRDPGDRVAKCCQEWFDEKFGGDGE